ncbi:hypothetical protein [Sphingomonas sp. PB4P5]|uniref:hypothetical protein n=1 Tax=Parasphingomonas puruogangriensis TaxID=3096155 RepID=UPI002FCACECB
MSEPATVRRSADAGTAVRESDDIVARGSLADCAETLETWSAEERAAIQIDIDDMDIRYGPEEIDTLLSFLRDESAGLSNNDIAAITDPDD